MRTCYRKNFAQCKSCKTSDEELKYFKGSLYCKDCLVERLNNQKKEDQYYKDQLRKHLGILTEEI